MAGEWHSMSALEAELETAHAECLQAQSNTAEIKAALSSWPWILLPSDTGYPAWLALRISRRELVRIEIIKRNRHAMIKAKIKDWKSAEEKGDRFF